MHPHLPMFDPDYLTGVFWFKNRAQGTVGTGSMETFAVRESLRNGLGATISKTIGWELSPKHRNFHLAGIKMVPVPCSSAPRFIWFSSRWNRISPQTWFKWLIRRCQNAKVFASYCIMFPNSFWHIFYAVFLYLWKLFWNPWSLFWKNITCAFQM